MVKKGTGKEGVSAFFPAYDEWGTLGSMIAVTSAILNEMHVPHEIIIINNGSTDYTDIVLKELKKKYDNLRIVYFPQNRGYGGALKAGFAAAQKEIVFYTDADAQYDMMELRTAISRMDNNTDAVIGYKINRADPYHRYLLGRMYQYFVKRLFGLRLKDVDCDFRLIRKRIIKEINLKSNSGVVCIELMKKIENRTSHIKEIPLKHFARAYGKSKFFDIRQVLTTLYNMVTLWLELRKENARAAK